MGIMLSVLFSYVGAVELAFIVRELTHQLASHQMRLQNEQRKQSDISVLQDKIRASIGALETLEGESVEQMQDGVLYKDGYRIDSEQKVEIVAQQWDERRKLMCENEVITLQSEPKSITSNGYTENGIQNKRTNNTSLNECEKELGNDDSLNDIESNEQNNYRPIVRDDRTGRRKAFKKRNSSSSSDSIRLSREEELKMFTSLEEEENRNSSYIPISYSNDSRKNVDSFHEKRKYDASWDNATPNTIHDTELWKRERATSIEEETEENSSKLKHISSDKVKRTGAIGTADKPTRKTPCENDKYASDLDACELLEQVENYDTLKQKHENISAEMNETMESQRMMKKIDNRPNLNQYINEALHNEVESNKTEAITKILIDKPYDEDINEKYISGTESRDIRSSTVYSRSESESSNIYFKSPSRDSSSTMDIDSSRQIYSRTDSTNSFIQDELDSEEYHHNHRFSIAAETLEYIRGREDWRVHTENKIDSIYRRQSSNISIREEIDSDEYHHDRFISDLVEIARLDVDNIESLPSSFKETDVFERYYLELQQINGQLSSDIEQNIAQKQIVLLDSNEVQTDGYIYPLPDIILDQIDDPDVESYIIEQVDSDYSNVSESDDDIQSVIEVNHEGEIITTLDMSGDIDEMIEVTLWDLKDDKELSSKESSVEIISMPNENLYGVDNLVEQSSTPIEASNYTISDVTIANDVPENIGLQTANNSSRNLNETTTTTYENSENNNLIAMVDVHKNASLETQGETMNTKNIGTNDATQITENLSNNNKNHSLAEKSTEDVRDTINDSKTTIDISENVSNVKDETIIKGEPSPSAPTNLGVNIPNRTVQNTGHHSSTAIEISKSFIEQENITSALGKAPTNLSSDSVETSTNSKKSKINKKVTFYENVDDLVKEGCMGVWFHN